MYDLLGNSCVWRVMYAIKWLNLRAFKSGFQEMSECRIFQYDQQVTEAEERAP